MIPPDRISPSAVRRVMVPLDGSPASEEALPLAAAVARRAGAGLVLVHVAEDVDRDVALAEEYPATLTGDPRLAGVPMEATRVTGPVTEALLAQATDARADLIVMTSRGRGGMTRALCGSVADAVIRRAEIPVLLVKQHPQQPPFRRVLVPLDGTTIAEEILPWVLAVTGAAKVHYVLLRVHPALTPDGRIEPGPPLGQRSDPVVDAYLSTIAARVSNSGVAVSWRAVVHGSNADTILKIANDENVDLIAMTTSGAGGVDRMVFGSVADAVVRNGSQNVLVLRPAASA